MTPGQARAMLARGILQAFADGRLERKVVDDDEVKWEVVEFFDGGLPPNAELRMVIYLDPNCHRSGEREQL